MDRIGALLGIFVLISVPAFAQRGEAPTGFSLVGLWSGMYHEDELERTDPGPPPGDYTGIPINDAARYHADSWDADLVSVMEHQCIPHNAIYSMRGPANLNVHAELDSSTGRLLAYVIDGTFGGATRTIWMDGRPHPTKYAAHTWGGFSTVAWEGDTLKVVTTHIKAGYLRRNGITFNDTATLTEFFDLHDKYLTVTTLELTVPEIAQEGGTMVIPGHGRLCDEADVTEYRDMVTIIRDRVADLIEKGKSLAEVKAARLTRDYDGRYSQPTWTGD